MDLKPINNNDTITFINTSTFKKSKIKTQKIVADPSGSIPNGIYGVIRWEFVRQFITAIITSILLITSVIIISLGATIWKFGPLTYIGPVILGLLSLMKLSVTIIEWSEIKRGVARYREDLKVGLKSTPPFIAKLYIKFFKKQVAHNWITFTTIFYGGIFTLMLWWLKDVNWWVLDFKTWIHNGIGRPNLVATLLAISLLITAIIHIIFTIQRKKKIADINLYFGMELAPESQIEEIKSSRNKAYRRLFFLSVLIILVIPMIVWIIYKIIKRRR